MSLYNIILTHSFIFNKKSIIFLYFFIWYQSHCWFKSELFPPTDLLSRISSDRSSQSDLLSPISFDISSQSDLLRQIFYGSSQPDFLQRIFSVESSLTNLFRWLFSSSTVLNLITSTPLWNTSGVTLSSASDRIKYTFITSLVHITYMLQL